MEIKLLSNLIEKGDPIVIIGISGSGKSTFIVQTANSQSVRKILRRRLAHGKGTLCDTKIIVSDYDGLPNDAIILTGQLKKYTGLDVNQENKLLGWIVYMAIKDYYKDNNNSEDYKTFAYTENLLKYLKEKIERSENDTTEFQLKNAGDETLKLIIEPLYSMDIRFLGSLYEENLNDIIKSKSTETKIKSFTDLLVRRASSDEKLKICIQQFWENIAEHINYNIRCIKDKIDTYNLIHDYTPNIKDDNTIELIVTENDINNEMVDGFLNGEKKGNELYVDDLTIIYKNNEMFSNNDMNKFAVMEIGNKIIHNLCLIDTKGLFHSQEVTSEDEKERIIDIAERYHCDKIIFTSNANVDVMVKNGMSAILQFYKNSKKNIKTYFLLTHFDELLLNVKRHHIEEDWALDGFEKDAFEVALADLQKDIDYALEDNPSKQKPKKPICITCGMLCGDAGASYSIDDVINSNECSYNATLDFILNDIQRDSNKITYKIKNESDLKCYIQVPGGKYDFTKIVLNLLDCRNDCEDISPIHPSWKTVEAIRRHWKYEGMEFESKARGLDSGYSKTSSYFVREIRNFVDNSLCDKVSIDVNGLSLLNEEQKQSLKKDLESYLKRELSTEVVKKIYNALEKDTDDFHISHYTYLRELLYNLQIKYFQYKHMYLMQDFIFAYHSAVQKCKIDFINQKCVEVY